MKDIKEFEGLYQASEDGNIFGVKYGRFLKPTPDFGGYLLVSLSKNSKTCTKRVHRLMAETFLPNPLNLPQVNHINGDKTDNRVENLEWCTSKDNIHHAMKIGLKNISGENQYNHKLTELQVLEIRELASSMRGVDIAKLYGVGKGCISQIIHRKSWYHI